MDGPARHPAEAGACGFPGPKRQKAFDSVCRKPFVYVVTPRGISIYSKCTIVIKPYAKYYILHIENLKGEGYKLKRNV